MKSDPKAGGVHPAERPGDGLDVAIDMSPMISGTTGVARFASALTGALEAAGVRLRKFALGRGVVPAPPDVRHVRIPLRVLRPVWRLTGYPKAETIAGGGLLHHALDLEPMPSRLPVVVTIHDLGALERPELHSRYHNALVRHHLAAARRADAVLVVSRVVGDQAIAAGCDPETVTVTPLGVTRLPPSRTPPPVHGPYVLTVGWLAKRKGIDVLVRAMARARLEGVRAVVAGAPSTGSAEVASLIQSLDVANRVVLLGEVGDEVLSSLYQGAIAMVHPSRIEGFGLTVLEALACGLPTVTSDLAALREVAGDAALFVPAGDPDALAAGLERIVTDEALRATLAARGPSRAAEFTWVRTAATTIEGYRRALDRWTARRRG